MKKAIIVINVPEDVELSNTYAQVITYFGGKSITDFPGLNYEIRPLPKKKNEEQYQDFGNGTSMYWTNEVINQNKGYNACIDEITGQL